MPRRATPLHILLLLTALLSVLAGVCRAEPPDAAGKTVRVAVLKNFPPMYLTDENGFPDGFAPEVVRRVLTRAGLTPLWVQEDDWNGLVDAVREGRADITALSPTPERAEVLDFGRPFLTSPPVLLVRSEGSGGIRDFTDMAGKTVALMRGSILPPALGELPGLRVVRGLGMEQNLFALLAGEVDAVLAGKLELQFMIRRAGMEHLVRFAPGPDMEYKRSLASAKNRPDLPARLNPLVEELVRSPEYQDMVERWYGKPVPFWTRARLGWTLGGGFALALLGFWLWHYRRVLRLNRRLAESLGQAQEAREALHHTGAMLEAVVRASPVAILVLDEQGLVRLWNPAAESLFGWSESEAMGRIPPVVQEEKLPEYHAIIAQILNGKRFTGLELQRRRRNGGELILSLHAAPLTDAGGRPEGVLGMLLDITARKQAENAHRQSEERLRLALDATRDGIWDWDLETGEVYRSPNDQRLLGYVPGEMTVGHESWTRHIHPEDQGRVATAQRRHIEEGAPYEIRYRVLTRDGVQRWIYSRGMVVAWDGQGRARRMVGVHQDISGMVQTQEELAAANEELAATNEELVQTNDEIMAEIGRRRQVEDALRRAGVAAEAASRTKSEFLANMSHEIRTPLNGMLGMLQLLKDTGLDGEQRECTQTALDSGRHLLTILNDVLDFSQMEAGALSLVIEPLDVPLVLASVDKLFGPVCRSRGLVFEIHADPALSRGMLGDPARLRQVLFNLAGNAVKFTETGFVRVEAYPLPPTRPGEARVFFTVSDSGVGIPDDRLHDIFEPFTQVDGTLTRRHQGTGLGLSIVKRLVTLMGGNVAIESELGVGTSVHFCIRAEAASRPWRPAMVSRPEAPPTPTLRVLVAEDDAINRTLAARFLEKLGHVAIQAENGRRAVDILRQEGIDCVLMDVQMPVMDGIAATRAIRSDPDLGDKALVPVIALTAHAMLGDRERCLEAGMDGYLAKPLDLEDLKAALRKHCKGAGGLRPHS
ncbi:PAS domain S-box protein [Desulfovibrio aminophilus]|nr:PAS domain S-box protein [Desulfovibrio aminophilus]MCM0755700.1 PAS domain S-box protein [Desulfovibrio aminophilus]